MGRKSQIGGLFPKTSGNVGPNFPALQTALGTEEDTFLQSGFAARIAKSR
jgi:hypothetical protein